MSTSSEPSSPELGSESRGSSVSTGLREEYEDLLRYAVVTPAFSGKLPPNPVHQPPRPQSPPAGTTRGPVQAEISKVELDESQPIPPPHPHPMTSQHLHHQPETAPTPPGPTPPGPPPYTQTDDITSSESHDQSRNSEEVIQQSGVDPEMARLENQLDVWCLDLKRNILAEFDQSRIRMMERHRAELHKERQQHAYELRQLGEELERYKELLVTYEQSIARKDHVVANLTRALQKQKEKVELQKSFSSWKLRHMDDKRESFTTVLARRHYHKKLKCHVLAAWFGVVQGRWKLRTERACQVKAEEVCVQLTNEYEERLTAMQHSLDSSQQEVAQLKTERDLYEENMKKAFMRGVCALNLEAMSMFRQQDPPHPHHTNGYHSDGDHCSVGGGHAGQDSGSEAPVMLPQTAHSETERQGQPLPNILLTASAGPQRGTPLSVPPQTLHKQPATTQSGTTRSGQKLSRKAARNKKAPSVVVERHVLVDK